jgi:hypothetical protein
METTGSVPEWWRSNRYQSEGCQLDSSLFARNNTSICYFEDAAETTLVMEYPRACKDQSSGRLMSKIQLIRASSNSTRTAISLGLYARLEFMQENLKLITPLPRPTLKKRGPGRRYQQLAALLLSAI